jgi:hypothetical protein
MKLGRRWKGKEARARTQNDRVAALTADGDGGILSIFADIFSAENVQSFSAKKKPGEGRRHSPAAQRIRACWVGSS